MRFCSSNRPNFPPGMFGLQITNNTGQAGVSETYQVAHHAFPSRVFTYALRPESLNHRAELMSARVRQGPSNSTEQVIHAMVRSHAVLRKEAHLIVYAFSGTLPSRLRKLETKSRSRFASTPASSMPPTSTPAASAARAYSPPSSQASKSSFAAVSRSSGVAKKSGLLEGRTMKDRQITREAEF